MGILSKNSWLRRNWYLIFVPVAIIGIGWAFLAYLKKNTTFDFTFDNQLSNLLNQVEGRYAQRSTEANQKGVGLYLNVPLTTLIKNDNALNLNLKDTLFNLSYEGEPIMRTAPESRGVDVAVGKKDSKSVTENVEILINSKTIQFIKKWLKKEQPKLAYNIKTRLFGVPYSFTGEKTITEEKKS